MRRLHWLVIGVLALLIAREVMALRFGSKAEVTDVDDEVAEVRVEVKEAAPAPIVQEVRGAFRENRMATAVWSAGATWTPEAIPECGSKVDCLR